MEERPSGRRRRILICSQNYAPELTGVGRYCGELGAFLAARGHAVEVVAAPPHYPGWSVPAGQGGYRREAIAGATVWRAPILVSPRMRGLRRLLAPASFAASAAPLLAWRLLVRRPGTVLLVEPTLLPALLLWPLARLTRARLVLHVQDLEAESAFAVGHMRRPLARGLSVGIVRFLRRRMDAVVTIGEGMAQRLGADPARIAIVRNWVDGAAIRPLGRPSLYRAELGLDAKDFVLLYAGSIGAKQALHVVLEAARRLEGRDVEGRPLRFVIAGEGPAKAALVKAYGHLPHVLFLPLQPEERLGELLGLADLHLLPQTGAAADLGLPSKLGGMIASGRPVCAMAKPGSDLDRLLHDAALLVPPDDAPALAGALLGTPQARLRLFAGRSARLLPLLSKDAALRRFEALLVTPEAEAKQAGRKAAEKPSATLAVASAVLARLRPHRRPV